MNLNSTRLVIYKVARLAIYAVIFAMLYLVFARVFSAIGSENSISIELKGVNMGEKSVEVFYKYKHEDEFTQDMSLAYFDDSVEVDKRIKLNMPSVKAEELRIDLGDGVGSEILINEIVYRCYNTVMRLTPKDISALELNQLKVKSVDDNAVVLVSEGDDPYITISDIELTSVASSSPVYPLIPSIIVLFVIYRFVKLRNILLSLKSLFDERRLIASLAVNDFKTRFAGSYFGIVWAYVQPICTILVFWFVFQVGFRNPNVGEVEYILWFMTGLIPWFFFSEAWNSATNAFMEYSYLVKKVVFKINILPIIKIISALFVHLFFVIFMMFVYMLYGRFPTVYYLQIIYYMLCMVVLVTALSFVTAPLIIFFRDLGQIMNIVLQFGMWLTPIMWSVDNLPAGMGIFVNIFKLNPMYYIVQGYRNSMIYNVMFYDNILQTVYFWCVILVLAVVGSVIYKRLKPHFADVL
jgi:teichoic acid transport system permease protein